MQKFRNQIFVQLACLITFILSVLNGFCKTLFTSASVSTLVCFVPPTEKRPVDVSHIMAAAKTQLTAYTAAVYAEAESEYDTDMKKYLVFFFLFNQF